MELCAPPCVLLAVLNAGKVEGAQKVKQKVVSNRVFQKAPLPCH